MHADPSREPGSESLLRRACAELEWRLRGGKPCTAEELLAAFPDLAAETDSALELVYTEFVLREHLGQRPDPADWLARFPQWRHDLEELFQVHQAVGQSSSDRFDDDTAEAHDSGEERRTESGGAGRRVGHYVLLEELGRGGMGVVYKARHEGLGRVVALKLILAGDYCGPRDLARFRTEAGAAARLQHPNIVQVHEVGEQDGRPYLSLELVTGSSLEEKLAEAPWAGRDAAGLVEVLARAMHYAHERGVVHRDLKPANVLLAPALGGGEVAGLPPKAGANWIPKVTDFGLARRLPDGEALWDACAGPTESGTVLGTPSYMAPEQAAGHSRAVGPAADVHALGAILYALLTGRPPFRGVTALETLEQVRSQEPVPPTRLQPRLPRDLETICLKCLQKDPQRRYESAAALAEDLQRFQAGEPIRARPVSAWERAVKWGKRRPAIASLLTAVVAVTALGLTTTTWLWRQAADALIETEKARQDARNETEKVTAALASKTIALARAAWLANDLDQARRYLEDCPPERRDREWHYLDRVSQVRLIPFGKDESIHVVQSVAWSPNGRDLLASSAAVVKVWDTSTWQERLTLSDSQMPAHQKVDQLAVTSDGRRLVTVSWPSLIRNMNVVLGVREPSWMLGKVWDLERGVEVRGYKKAPCEAPVLSRDGRFIAARGLDVALLLLDAESGEQIQAFQGGPGWYNSFALSDDGRFLAACAQEERIIRIWDLPGGRERDTLRLDGFAPFEMVFSPDGRRLAGIWRDVQNRRTLVTVREVDAGREIAIYRSPADLIKLVFSPDGRQLAIAGTDKAVILWDVATGKELLTFRGHAERINSVAFSPDGSRLASSSWDGMIRIWDVRPLEDDPSVPPPAE
jgi:serine/threonine protein kinase/WD40 repeat protein